MQSLSNRERWNECKWMKSGPLHSLIHSIHWMWWSESNAAWIQSPIEESKAQFMPQFNLHFIPLRRCGIEVNWMQAMNEESGSHSIPISLSLHSRCVNAWNEESEMELKAGASGFIPFHEVHSAFINYTPWIDLAKLNGMRMNDIITVQGYKSWGE